MQHLISKADILEYEEFSGNIEDRVINPRINDAHVYDLRGLLPLEVIGSVYNATTAPAEWDSETAYLTAEMVSFGGLVYDAVSNNTGIEPGENVSEWKLNTGASLRYVILKPFLVWSALRRYYVRAGRNISPAGITVPTDPQGTFQPISDQARASLIAEASSKAEFHRQDVLNFLHKNNLTHTGNCERGYPVSRGRAWGV